MEILATLSLRGLITEDELYELRLASIDFGSVLRMSFEIFGTIGNSDPASLKRVLNDPYFSMVLYERTAFLGHDLKAVLAILKQFITKFYTIYGNYLATNLTEQQRLFLNGARQSIKLVSIHDKYNVMVAINVLRDVHANTFFRT